MSAKILIVDDDVEIVDMIETLLAANGYTVVRAATGGEALTVARKELPDMVILDALLPQMSRLDVCRTLKSSPDTNKTVVLMLTALGQMGDVEKAFSLGANDYLIKPFDNERLMRKIEKLLSKT